MSYRSFEELEVWNRACELAVRVYNMMKESRDSFKDQMTRAALSIASNIREAEQIQTSPVKTKGLTFSYNQIYSYY